MGQFTVPEVAKGALLSNKLLTRILGTNGFRAFNSLAAENFDNSTNVPVDALATPRAHMLSAFAIGAASVSVSAAATTRNFTRQYPVMVWSRLDAFSVSARYVTGAPKVQVIVSCAHTNTNTVVGSVTVSAALTNYTGSCGSYQLHVGDMLVFRLVHTGGAAQGLGYPCCALVFDKKLIP